MYCPFIVGSLRLYGDHYTFCCKGDSFYNPIRPNYLSKTDAAEMANDILEKRNRLHSELQGEIEIDLAKNCLSCKRLIKGKFEHVLKFTSIGFPIYPSPCQARCIYCDIYKNSENSLENSKTSPYHRLMTEVVVFMKEKGHIADSCSFNFSSGEITIMPHKNLLLDTVSGYKCKFLTNGYIFDEQIAKCLEEGGHLTVSLDCGTAETFKKVKGSNNFNKVVENLMKYRKHGDVWLKYVVMLGVNDGEADIQGFLDIMSELNPRELRLNSEYFIPLRSAFYIIARFSQECFSRKISFGMESDRYTKKNLLDFAEKLLPVMESRLLQKRDYCTEVFSEKYSGDYDSYREFIYNQELTELIQHTFNPNTRFCIIGKDVKAKKIQSVIEEVHGRKISAARTPELALEIIEHIDVYISLDSKTARHFKSLPDFSQRGWSVIVIALDEYMNSFEPVRRIFELKDGITRQDIKDITFEKIFRLNERLQQENDALKNQAQKVQSRHERLTRRNERFQSENETLKNQAQKIQNRNERLINKNETMKNEIQELTGKLNKLQFIEKQYKNLCKSKLGKIQLAVWERRSRKKKKK